MSLPYVCVYASQVAVCIGANRHKKASEAMEAMWHRISPASFRAAMVRNGQKTDDQSVTDLMARSGAVKALVDRSMKAACESSDQVAANYDTVSRELRTVCRSTTALSADDERLVDDVIKRNLYTAYGTQHEHRALQYIRDTLHMDCHPDPTFYKQQAGVVRGVPWYVGGKIDAIARDKSVLVEIKNRVNRLFYRVPFYEVVQVQTYLELLNMDKGVLVECLNSRATPPPPGMDFASVPGNHTHPGNHTLPPPPDTTDTTGAAAAAADMVHVNVVPLTRDRELWAREIMPKLEAFVDFLLLLVESPKMQDRYLQSPRRSVLVLNHITQRVRA